MTNVKIKLMFFVLYALLTADFVNGRPYNDTDRTNLDFSENYTSDYSIPVESNADTLIVAHDDETPEEQNKNSNTQMHAMMNAEMGRDVLILSKKNEAEPAKVLEIPKDDAIALEKQLNISSPLLEEIIDSETGREETLTDIMFRPEFVADMPKFEFLISAKINETNLNGTAYGNNELGKYDKNSSDILRKSDYVELVAIGKNSKLSENKSEYSLVNITGHEVDNDLAPDTSFTDMQTVFLACIATLLPLLGVLFATLCIRCMIRRWCPGCCKKRSDSTDSESSDVKPDTNHTQKCSEVSTGTGGDPLDPESEAPAANGSIITMTLKNNHLIVETEERNDITKNGRETKMKYSPNNDGIFVVEVQQSAIYRPNHNKSMQNSPPHDPQISTNQALIHRVPEELETSLNKPFNVDLNEGSEKTGGNFDRGKGLALSNTGLSISDLSMSSVGSPNVSYSYGSQIGYEQGPFGYPVYAGYDIPKEDIGDGIIHDNSREPLICKTPTDPDKPVLTAVIFKQDSIIGNDALQGPGYSIEGSSDGPLLSDVQAREVSLQNLHDQMEKKIENCVPAQTEEKKDSPKNQLNRSDSLPVKLDEDKTPEPVIDKYVAMDTIREDDVLISKEQLKGKRASLPIIKTEMYDCVKDTIPISGSPEFERFNNEISDGSMSDNPPPMITITEENETATKFENGDS